MPGEPRRVVIGRHAVLQGRLSPCDTIVVEGRYEGEPLHAKDILITPSGRVHAHLHADSVTVEGVLIGDIHASVRVLLMPTARMTGRISTHELIIQRGVVFDGTCEIRHGQERHPRDIVHEAYASDHEP